MSLMSLHWEFVIFNIYVYLPVLISDVIIKLMLEFFFPWK